ncbi:MAG: fumarylacetoacetate hydrolase family protein [Chloroflexi bacterium]|nr:fumarylacetoacetate hydrolase family protein [Chloroflexota bacterium]
MRRFSLATIARRIGDREREVGALVLDGRLYPLDQLAPDRPALHAGLFGLLQHWDNFRAAIYGLAAGIDPWTPALDPADPSVRVLAPLRFPRAIFCTVFNYYDFAAEAGVTPPDKSATRPYVCIKLPHSVVGPNETIVLPHTSKQVDWECELGAVIARPCRNVFVKDALDYVAGYTIVNDISARDIIQRPDWPNFASDWLESKNFDTGTPMGPYMLPRELVPDPQNVRLKLTRNGTVQQDGNTSTMIFTLAEQIAHISQTVTLLPGDVIATGTPAGVGWKRGLGLQPGDTLDLELPDLPEAGVLHNSVTGPLTLAPPNQGTAFA